MITRWELDLARPSMPSLRCCFEENRIKGTTRPLSCGCTISFIWFIARECVYIFLSLFTLHLIKLHNLHFVCWASILCLCLICLYL